VQSANWTRQALDARFKLIALFGQVRMRIRSALRREQILLDSLPCRCQPVDLLRALDRILEASKQRASAAQKSIERWKVSRQGKGLGNGHDSAAIIARFLCASCVPLAPNWAKLGHTQTNSNVSTLQ
jgi:hypothetical protein